MIVIELGKYEDNLIYRRVFTNRRDWEEHVEEEEIRVATIQTDNKKVHTVLNYNKKQGFTLT